MYKVVLKQARPGMTLARVLQDPHRAENALLSRGDILSPEVIAFLHESGVYDLWVQDPGPALMEDSAGVVCQKRQHLCDVIRQGFQSAAQRANNCTSQTRDALRAMMQILLTSTLPCIDALAAADEHVIRHGAEVCYTALLLGVKLQDYMMEQRKRPGRIPANDLVNFALGCLFHDMGDTLLKEKDRESQRVESSHASEWQRHTDLGFNLVRNQLEPSAAAILLHHHQHFDGTGFPASPGKPAPAGSQIHIFSRIAFVADTFIHFLQHDSIPMPTLHALWRLQSPTCRNWCDPVVLAALTEIIPPFLPGMVVQLSDRRHAVITRIFAEAPCYPEVQTLATHAASRTDHPRELIPLAPRTDIWLQSVDGIDITPFTYGPRECPAPQRAARVCGRIAVAGAA